MGFLQKNTMNMAWESHEKSMKIPLIFNASWPMKKVSQTKSHEKKIVGFILFHGFLMIMKEPWIEKLFFMVSEFMGFSWGFLNSCPIKKPWVFRERLNINGSWKMKWLLMTFSLPMNYTPGLLFMGKTETWPPWIFSLKLFLTVKSNTSLGISGLVNLKLYTCSNNPNPKQKLTVFRVSA